MPAQNTALRPKRRTGYVGTCLRVLSVCVFLIVLASLLLFWLHDDGRPGSFSSSGLMGPLYYAISRPRPEQPMQLDGLVVVRGESPMSVGHSYREGVFHIIVRRAGETSFKWSGDLGTQIWVDQDNRIREIDTFLWGEAVMLLRDMAGQPFADSLEPFDAPESLYVFLRAQLESKIGVASARGLQVAYVVSAPTGRWEDGPWLADLVAVVQGSANISNVGESDEVGYMTLCVERPDGSKFSPVVRAGTQLMINYDNIISRLEASLSGREVWTLDQVKRAGFESAVGVARLEPDMERLRSYLRSLEATVSRDHPDRE